MNNATKTSSTKPMALPISIIVPTLNEADNMTPLAQRIDATLSAASIPYELIIIDDHSSDGTQAVANKLAASYPVRLFDKQGKRGKAYSLLEGFTYARYPVLCMIDADLQYPPEAIAPMYRKLVNKQADVVVTNRIEQKTSPLRQLSTKVCHFLLARVLFGIDYDTQSGLKLFRRDVLQNMDLKPSAWSFDLEFLIRSLENGHRILSHAIPFSERVSGEAKIKLLSGTYDIVSSSVRLRMNSSIRKVRRGYRGSLELSRRPMLLLASILGTAVLAVAAAPAGHSQAMSILGVHVPGTSNQAPAATTPSSSPANNQSNQSAAQPITQSSGAPASSDTATPATTATTAQPASSTATVQSTTKQTTPKTIASNNSSTTTATETTGSGKQTAQPTTTSSAAASGTASGSQPNYYPDNSLSATRTSNLLELSIILAAIGGSVIAIGLLIVLVRNLYRTFTNRRISDTI